MKAFVFNMLYANNYGGGTMVVIADNPSEAVELMKKEYSHKTYITKDEAQAHLEDDYTNWYIDEERPLVAGIVGGYEYME